MSNEVVIVSAIRTATGKFRGVYKNTSAITLGMSALKKAILDAHINPDEVEYTIMGNVLQSGLGQNPARQVAINAGIPVSKPALTVNEVCGSGLKAIHLGIQKILLGDYDIVAVGGFENMTQSPLLLDRFDPSNQKDSIYFDGLEDAFSRSSMGMTVEKLIEKHPVSRQEQDLYAYHSQKRASFATKNGYFKDQIVGVETEHGLILEDEPIRHETDLNKLSELKTIFSDHGTITAGNASSINDGASALILMSKKEAVRRNIPILATFKGFTEIGVDPEEMGIAPLHSIHKILTQQKMELSDIDLFEINESFAGQVLLVSKPLNIPHEKLNVNGGAISLGHPIGSSGSRIIVSLVHELNRQKKKLGLASLCIGGGIGMSMLIEGNNYES